MNVEAVFARHHTTYYRSHDNLEDALAQLKNDSDYGYIYAIGVLVDGKCVRADPYLEPDQLPTTEQAARVEESRSRAKRWS